MKRAQSNQIFVYVLGLVIIAGILILGYKMIFSVKNTESGAQIEALKSSLQKDVNGITSEYDNKRTFLKTISSRYIQVCFADIAQKQAILSDDSANPIVKDSVEDSDNNVFLINGQIVAFKINELRVDKPYHCYNTTGMLNYTLQGKGEYALLITPLT